MAITFSLCCSFIVLQKQLPAFIRIYFAKMTNEGNIHSRSIQKQMLSGIRELALTRFSDSKFIGVDLKF